MLQNANVILICCVKWFALKASRILLYLQQFLRKYS